MKNEKRIKEIFQTGLDRIRPLNANASDIVGKAYQIGFDTCWNIFTGEASPMSSDKTLQSKQDTCATTECHYRGIYGCGVLKNAFCPLYIPVKANRKSEI